MSYTLGFDTNQFKKIQNANLTPVQLQELYQRASWFALGAQSLFMLFGEQIESNTHQDLWNHFPGCTFFEIHCYRSLSSKQDFHN